MARRATALLFVGYWLSAAASPLPLIVREAQRTSSALLAQAPQQPVSLAAAKALGAAASCAEASTASSYVLRALLEKVLHDPSSSNSGAHPVALHALSRLIDGGILEDGALPPSDLRAASEAIVAAGARRLHGAGSEAERFAAIQLLGSCATWASAGDSHSGGGRRHQSRASVEAAVIRAVLRACIEMHGAMDGAGQPQAEIALEAAEQMLLRTQRALLRQPSRASLVPSETADAAGLAATEHTPAAALQAWMRELKLLLSSSNAPTSCSKYRSRHKRPIRKGGQFESENTAVFLSKLLG